VANAYFFGAGKGAGLTPGGGANFFGSGISF
jgi:hypothetical protein